MTEFFTEICKQAILGQKDIYKLIYFYGEPEKISCAMDVITRGWDMLHWEEPRYRTSGIAFRSDVLQAIKNADLDSFTVSIPKRGLLVFEGFEAIAGMDVSMRLFYGLFDSVYEHGGQILIGSLFPPASLHNVTDRVYTQVSSGIVYCVDGEDFTTSFEDLDAAGLKLYKKRDDSVTPHKPKPYHALITTPDGFSVGVGGDSWKEIAAKAKHIQSRGVRIDRRGTHVISANPGK